MLKRFLSALGGLLAFIMITALFLQVFLPNGNKPVDWFTKDTEQTEQQGETATASNDLVVTVENTASTFRLARAMAYTASEPRSVGEQISVVGGIEDSTYLWELSGIDNPGNYIKLSATTGETITVSALAPFSQQITLTCKASFYGEQYSSASCTLDYAARLIGVKCNNVDVTGSNYDISGCPSLFDACRSVFFYIEPIYSVGTLNDWEITERNVGASFTSIYGSQGSAAGQPVEMSGKTVIPFMTVFGNAANSAYGANVAPSLTSAGACNTTANQIQFFGQTMIGGIKCTNTRDGSVETLTFGIPLPTSWTIAAASVTLTDSNLVL